jgi:osmotically inducible protein OsmC
VAHDRESGTPPLSFRDTFKSRLEQGEAATNPEELTGAAHAGCFTMALTARIHTGATVTLSKVGDEFAITRIDLDLEEDLPPSIAGPRAAAARTTV